MNESFQKRPLLKTGVFGLLLLPFVILINSHSPEKCRIPAGYSSSIVAFEFVSDVKEVSDVLDLLDESDNNLDCKKTNKEGPKRNYRNDIDVINYVDFGMMVIYGIFLFLFMANFGKITDDHLIRRAKWLAPVVVLFDALENIQLIKINQLYPENVEALTSPIDTLIVCTWIKWLGLAVLLSVVAWRLIKMGFWSKLSSVFLIAPVLLGLIALFASNNKLEDLFATSVFGGISLLIVFAFLYKDRALNMDDST